MTGTPTPAVAGPTRRRPRPRPLAGLHGVLLRPPVEAVLNAALAGALADGRLDCLEGRVLALEAAEARLRWPLSVLRGRLLVLPPPTAADTVIRGGIGVFAAIARRRLDPDTAFFQRRLVVEGDTELALAAKNALDGIDPRSLPHPLRMLLPGR